jgi:hypothetical protein
LVEVLHTLLTPHEFKLEEILVRQSLGRIHGLAMVLKRSVVSSLLSKNRPQPSKRRAMFSTFVPEKSSKQTLNMCRMTWEGTTRNFVKFERKIRFYKSELAFQNHSKGWDTFSLTSANSLTTFFFLCK